MAILPKRDLIQLLIEGDKIVKHRPRSYLGYSGMASACARSLKYSLHWAFISSYERRVERIFKRGDYEETVLADDFKRVGITLFDDQLEVVGGHGYAKGHIDGKLLGVPGYEIEVLLFEAKTMNDKRFKEYIKNGLQSTNPVYYGQIMSYMGKLGLERTLYVVANKNDENRSYKIIDFDADEYNRLEDVANTIPLMDELPEKIGGKTWHACKYCDARQVCHYNAKPRKTCRTCCFVTLEGDGKWGCSHIDSDNLSYDEQLNGCDEYVLDGMFGVQ